MRPLEPAVFASPAAIVAGALAQLACPEPLTVSDTAERYGLVRDGGGQFRSWTFDRAPYLRRPMDCLALESGYSLVAVMGPSQCGKSQIGNNWFIYSVLVDEGSTIFLGPDREIQRSYVTSEINPLIDNIRELRARLLDTPSANNIFQKDFHGASLFVVWPVKSQLRARPVPRFRVDDYDAVPEDIEGEGNALMLLSGRQIAFEDFNVGYVNSSPALGPLRGIEALVAGGTDERWHVDCGRCDATFRLDFDECLTFDHEGTPADARESAVVVCPVNGCVIEPKHKQELNATGRWLGADQALADDGAVAGELRDVATASFRFDGLMGFASWGRLAELARSAELTYERAQDEFELRAFYQSHVGKNYVSRVSGEAPVDIDELELRVEGSDYELGTVPAWCIAVTAAVDIQRTSFEVLVVGWGEGWRSARVDRFAIMALDDGETRIDPGGRAEHWETLLERVIWRRYPVAGKPDLSIPILCTAIDTGGLEGVTDNAFGFWALAVKKGVPPTGITLIKGGNKPNARLLPAPTIDAKRKGVPGLPDPELFVPNVNRIKDTVDARLRRREPGSGYMDYPRGFKREYLEETTAETKVDGIWTRPRHVRNETLDLEVYNYVNMVRLGGSDSSLAWVPTWARARPGIKAKGASGTGRRARPRAVVRKG